MIIDSAKDAERHRTLIAFMQTSARPSLRASKRVPSWQRRARLTCQAPSLYISKNLELVVEGDAAMTLLLFAG